MVETGITVAFESIKPCAERDTLGSRVPEKKMSKPYGSPLQKNKNGKDKIKILVNTSNFGITRSYSHYLNWKTTRQKESQYRSAEPLRQPDRTRHRKQSFIFNFFLLIKLKFRWMRNMHSHILLFADMQIMGAVWRTMPHELSCLNSAAVRVFAFSGDFQGNMLKSCEQEKRKPPVMTRRLIAPTDRKFKMMTNSYINRISWVKIDRSGRRESLWVGACTVSPPWPELLSQPNRLSCVWHKRWCYHRRLQRIAILKSQTHVYNV